MLTKYFQYLSQMEQMFLYCCAVSEKVVEVYNDEAIKVGMENIVHQSHECGWGIALAKREYCEFEKSVTSTESCFGNSILIQSDLMITGSKVDFGEEFFACKAIEYFIYTR
jgi:hypothetical protein